MKERERSERGRQTEREIQKKRGGVERQGGQRKRQTDRETDRYTNKHKDKEPR